MLHKTETVCGVRICDVMFRVLERPQLWTADIGGRKRAEN